MVKIGEVHAAVRLGAPPHGQIALGDEHEIAAERAAARVPQGEDRRCKAMVKAEINEGC